MSWIKVIDEGDAEGRLARLYRANLDPEHAVVDNILKIHSLRPDTLDGHLKLYRSALQPSPVVGMTRREREIVAVAVSAFNECHY